MALLAGLTNEDQLGGLIVFSGMLPVRNLLPEVSPLSLSLYVLDLSDIFFRRLCNKMQLVRDLDRTNVPVFWGHGQDDPYLL